MDIRFRSTLTNLQVDTKKKILFLLPLYCHFFGVENTGYSSSLHLSVFFLSTKVLPNCFRTSMISNYIFIIVIILCFGVFRCKSN